MRILYTWIILLCSLNMLAQSYTVKGRVSDYHGEALIGATISLEDQVFITDLKGNFQSKPIEKGHYQFTISYLGYETLTTTLNSKEIRNLICI